MLIDFPLQINRISMGFPIIHLSGRNFQIIMFMVCISVAEDCFYQ